MIRHQRTHLISVVLCCASAATILFVTSPARGQNGQRAASARIAREKIAAKELANKSVTAKDAGVTDASESEDKQSEKLGRRAGEQVGNDPRGKSLVLGMNLQEVDNGRVRVVEVGASSPAFDAGIQKGDELVSFQNFHADSYRKWIDGIRRLATDAPDGAMLPVVVLREGKRLAVQVRIPESTLANVQLPVGPPPQVPLQEQQQPGPQGSAGPGGVAGGGYGNDVLINNGLFGNFFNDEASPATERAMAQLFRVGGGQQATQGGATPSTAGAVAADAGRGAIAADASTGAAPADGGARIGLAGFRNDPNGMLVMIDVGGLQPGNYSVGISDPSVIEGQSAPGTSTPPNVQPPTDRTTPQPAQPQLPRPTNGTGAGEPQSKLQPATQREIPSSVLAQISDNGQPNGTNGGTPGPTIPPTGQVRPLTTPPTGQVQPLTAPPTGQVNPSSTTPTGQSEVNNALTDQLNRSPAVGAANPIRNEIGTLTVDQSGTGRMQQVVEGVQVHNVVGQAIVIFTQPGGDTTTLPPNLDPTVDPAGGGQSPAEPAPTDGGQQPVSQTGAGSPGAPAGRATTGAPMPVAAGIIRLISDRRPPTTGGEAPEDAFGSQPTTGTQPTTGQPATPPVPQNPNQ